MSVKPVSVDTTEMDPIVFANTYNYVTQEADHRGFYLHDNGRSLPHFQLRTLQGDEIIQGFESILDVKEWLDKYPHIVL